MPRVCWSEKAKQDLKAFVTIPTVRDRMERNAEEALHDPYVSHPSCAKLGDAGAYGKVMWHRATDHDHEGLPEQADDGPQSYFLFYWRSDDPAYEFEVLAVRSIQQVANFWQQMGRE